MAWIYLVVAGILEVGWATALKASEGLTRPLPSIVFLLVLAGSMALLALAQRTLPLGTAYGVWVGIGALGAFVVGALVFHEPVTLPRVFFVALLLVAIVGMKLTTPDTTPKAPGAAEARPGG